MDQGNPGTVFRLHRLNGNHHCAQTRPSVISIMFPQTLLWDPSLLNLDANWGQAGQRQTILVLVEIQSLENALRKSEGYFGNLWPEDQQGLLFEYKFVHYKTE